MKVDMKMIGEKELEKILHEHPAKLQKKMQSEVMKISFLIRNDAIKNIDRNKTTDSGALKGSIIADTKNNWKSAEIGSVEKKIRGVMVNYAACVEFGTRPHFPPPDKLLMWVKRKALGIGGHIAGGRKPATSGSGREKELNIIKNIAFMVARAISKKGTQSQPFLYPAFHKHERKLPKNIKTKFEEGKY